MVVAQALQVDGKLSWSVILSEAKNLSSISVKRKNKERYFASFRMTSFWAFPTGRGLRVLFVPRERFAPEKPV
jgi:hypothetical protein